MMEDFYDTGYDYAGFDVYVGTGAGDSVWRDLPFIAQADFIRDLQQGRINLSAKSALVHAGTLGSSTLGAHYLSTKGFLDPALFNLRRAQYGIRTMQAQAMMHSMRGVGIGLSRLAPTAGWLGAGLGAAYGVVVGLEYLIQDVWLGDMNLKFGGDQ
jgi:hypothetical protein